MKSRLFGLRMKGLSLTVQTFLIHLRLPSAEGEHALEVHGVILPSPTFLPSLHPCPYSACPGRQDGHTGVGPHRNLGEDVEDERQHRHVHLDPLAPEPLLQVLRHCDHTGCDVHGDEDPAEGQKQPGCLGEWAEEGVRVLDA